jgi:hypothetical protein
MIGNITIQKTVALVALSTTAQMSLAGRPLGVDLGSELGTQLGSVVGQSLPVGLGGIVGITAISLIIGIQLVKRKNK